MTSHAIGHASTVAASPRREGAWRWRSLSIRAKLPIGAVLLVALASAAVTGAAYVRVRAFVLGSASDRLFRAATQVSDILGKSVRQRATALQQAAHAPVLAALSTHGDASEVPAARDSLVKLAGPGAAATVGVLALDGHVIVASDDTPLSLPQVPSLQPLASDAAAFAVTPLVRRPQDGRLSYVMTVGMYDHDRLVAYLVEHRQAGGGRDTVALMTGLIGTQAQLTFGNARGDVWTDFALPAAPATSAILHGANVTATGREDLFARTAPIPGTPWVSGVGFPVSPVMQPVHRFLIECTLVATGVIALAGFAAWWGSRRITGPLARLTDAAASLANGDPAPVLALDRRDELGRLAASFNQMAQRVTESRRALEHLVNDLEGRVTARTADLESANRELEAFSYSVSHDLRAPLRAVAGFSKILLEDHASSLNASGRECVETIARRAGHMGQLIDDLLAFSRLGRTTIQRETVDMNRMVRGIIDEIVRANPARRIVWDTQPMPPAFAAPALVQQVLANLLQNAVKFTRTRDEARIGVGVTNTDRGPAYFVRDNGVGFDMQYADRLFGVFQRLHAQHEFEGTGVGLAIVHRVVDRHGGQVWVEARPDVGATFYFTLPRDTGDVG